MATIDIGNGFKIVEDFITPNPYSRPQTKLTQVTKIAIHYVGNPMSSAKNNRDYFNNLATTHYTYVSSHYIIGLNGEILQCIPTSEIAYCTNSANSYSISIETCHPDSTGKFNDITEKALIQLTAYLLKQFNLKAPDDIIRHYDITPSKICPMYYVNNPAAYINFKNQVVAVLKSMIPTTQEKKYYKINKTFNNGLWNADQKGAFDYNSIGLEDAINFYKQQKLSNDYFIFDPAGTVVYPKNEVDEIAPYIEEIEKLQAKNKALASVIYETTMLNEQLTKEKNTLVELNTSLNGEIQLANDGRYKLQAILDEVHRITG